MLHTQSGDVYRAIIADDDAIIRYTLSRIAAAHCNIVAEADDGQAAVELVEEYRPDLVLLDISMPILNGFEAAQQIKNQWPEVRIIFVSSHCEAAYVAQAFRAGAQGYVFKGSALLQLPHAIDEVVHGRVFRPT